MSDVSVIIAAYNQAAFLHDAMGSVVDQLESTCQIIVVDDGSDDETASVAADFGDRIQYLRNRRNRGVSYSRNRGIRASSGDYLIFLDADDLLLEGKLRSQSRFLDDHPEVGLVYSDSLLCDATGKSLGVKFSEIRSPHSGDVLDPLCRHNFVPINAAMVRRDYVELVGGFDERFHLNEDWHLWLRMASIAEFRHEPDILSAYRLHETSATSDRHAMSRANVQLRSWIIESPLFSQLTRRTRHYCYLSCGVSFAKTGDIRRGRQMLKKALRIRPFHLPSQMLWALSFTDPSSFARVETALKALWLRATGRHRWPVPL